MEQTTKDKLAINVANLPKMATTWVVVIVSAVAGWYLELPVEKQKELLSHLPISPWILPFLAGLVPTLIARVVPQKGITAEVAAAKSADSPQPAAGETTVEFPQTSGSTPLPPIDRGDTHL